MAFSYIDVGVLTTVMLAVGGFLSRQMAKMDARHKEQKAKMDARLTGSLRDVANALKELAREVHSRGNRLARLEGKMDSQPTAKEWLALMEAALSGKVTAGGITMIRGAQQSERAPSGDQSPTTDDDIS